VGVKVWDWIGSLVRRDWRGRVGVQGGGEIREGLRGEGGLGSKGEKGQGEAYRGRGGEAGQGCGRWGKGGVVKARRGDNILRLTKKKIDGG